jgi:hypothetical protein
MTTYTRHPKEIFQRIHATLRARMESSQTFSRLVLGDSIVDGFGPRTQIVEMSAMVQCWDRANAIDCYLDDRQEIDFKSDAKPYTLVELYAALNTLEADIGNKSYTHTISQLGIKDVERLPEIAKAIACVIVEASAEFQQVQV